MNPYFCSDIFPGNRGHSPTISSGNGNDYEMTSAEATFFSAKPLLAAIEPVFHDFQFAIAATTRTNADNFRDRTQGMHIE